MGYWIETIFFSEFIYFLIQLHPFFCKFIAINTHRFNNIPYGENPVIF